MNRNDLRITIHGSRFKAISKTSTTTRRRPALREYRRRPDRSGSYSANTDVDGGSDLNIVLNDQPVTPPPGGTTLGTTGNDTLGFPLDGSVTTINGLAGNDAIQSASLSYANPAGGYLMLGGTGDDTIQTEYDAIRRAHLTTPDYTAQWLPMPAAGQGVRAFGEEGNDYAEGGLRDDALDGGSGHDEMQGLTGGDTVRGGTGSDWLEGNEGDDTIVGGNETLGIETDNDRLLGGAGADVIVGGAGNDRLWGDAESGEIHRSATDYSALGWTNLPWAAEPTAPTGWDGAQELILLKTQVLYGSSIDFLRSVYGAPTAREPVMIEAPLSLDPANPYTSPLGKSDNDSLDGGAGVDRLYGGAGNDIPRRRVFRFPDKPVSRRLVSVETAAYRLAA